MGEAEDSTGVTFDCLVEAWGDIDVDDLGKLLRLHAICLQCAGKVGEVALEDGFC